MIPEKEHLKVLERFAKRETAIYSNSADTGVYVNETELAQIRTAVKALKKYYSGRNWTCNTSRMKQAAVKDILIPYEVEGETAAGVKVDVTVVQSLKKGQFARPNQKYVTIRIVPFYKRTDDVPILFKNKMDQTIN